jgi:HD superfamily phosphohydrolase
MLGADGEMQICFEEKMAMSLGDIFALRAKLHKYAYQHRIVKAIDHMVSDILLLAEPFFKVRGKTISECAENVDDFIHLGDWIISAMAASDDPNLEPAKKLYDRINSRDLYKLAGLAMCRDYREGIVEDEVKTQILSELDLDGCTETDEQAERVRNIIAKQLIVEIVKIHYGSSDSSGNPDDPINNVSFYNPKSLNANHRAYRLPIERQSPLFRPQHFGEKSVFIFLREKTYAPEVAEAFGRWKSRHRQILSEMVPACNLPQSPQPQKYFSYGKRKRADGTG